MQLHSPIFILFLMALFLPYWTMAHSAKMQNTLLILASAAFYCTWNLRIALLPLIIAFTTFHAGIYMHDVKNSKLKAFSFWAACSVSLGALFIFKYYNFFMQSLLPQFNAATTGTAHA